MQQNWSTVARYFYRLIITHLGAIFRGCSPCGSITSTARDDFTRNLIHCTTQKWGPYGDFSFIKLFEIERIFFSGRQAHLVFKVLICQTSRWRHMSVTPSQITEIRTVCVQAVTANIKIIINHYWPFVGELYRWPLDFLHTGPIRWKPFPCVMIFKLHQSYFAASNLRFYFISTN